jgi:hypothetical protein
LSGITQREGQGVSAMRGVRETELDAADRLRRDNEKAS